ncbi:MAG: thioredoxin [Oscillospiraceae bacterium]|jgi:thioredoxin 1|nr:thioredoxin [Oscillospiraceae bacterium]
MTEILNEEKLEFEIKNSNIPILVDFFAEWCGPCKMMSPIIDDLEKESGGKFKVFKVNIDDSQNVSNKLGIMSIPTFIIFKNGKEFSRQNGAIPKESLEKFINSSI